jgi:hypothetical protein
MDLHKRLEALKETIEEVSLNEAKKRVFRSSNHTPTKFFARMKKSIGYIGKSLTKTASQINERSDLGAVHDTLLRLSNELKIIMKEVEEKTKNHV